MEALVSGRDAGVGRGDDAARRDHHRSQAGRYPQNPQEWQVKEIGFCPPPKRKKIFQIRHTEVARAEPGFSATTGWRYYQDLGTAL